VEEVVVLGDESLEWELDTEKPCRGWRAVNGRAAPRVLRGVEVVVKVGGLGDAGVID